MGDTSYIDVKEKVGRYVGTRTMIVCSNIPSKFAYAERLGADVIYKFKSDAIAQWIHLHLPFCRPGFEPHAHHSYFYHFSLICTIFVFALSKERKTNKKAGFCTIKKQFKSSIAMLH